MTGQDLLDRMELLNQELQLQPSEADVTRGLLALNVAQDYFETYAARRPDLLGSGTGTVVTADGVETTSFPAGLLRVDRLQMLDSNNLPIYNLSRAARTGGHAGSTRWPLYQFLTSTTGKPLVYWTNGTNIYWNPLPDGVHTVRWYGLGAATAITAGGTFAYPDIVALPVAAFAGKLMKLGVEDDPAGLDKLAAGAFDGVLDTLASFNRDGAVALDYTETHNT